MDPENGNSFSGSFYLIKGENVMIETEQGVKMIPLSQFSGPDQQWVQNKLEWIKKSMRCNTSQAPQWLLLRKCRAIRKKNYP